MNGRAQAIQAVKDFLASQARCFLLSGTYQYEKHKIVLSVLRGMPGQSTILFRVNGMDNAGSFLGKDDIRVKSGQGYRFGKHKLYIDSLNPVTQNRSPWKLDYAVLYPVDSVCRMTKREEEIKDLLVERQIGKVFLVTWTDAHDLGWLDTYVDQRAVYDAEEEDPEYHRLVLDRTSESRRH